MTLAERRKITYLYILHYVAYGTFGENVLYGFSLSIPTWSMCHLRVFTITLTNNNVPYNNPLYRCAATTMVSVPKYYHNLYVFTFYFILFICICCVKFLVNCSRKRCFCYFEWVWIFKCICDVNKHKKQT